MQYTPWNKGLTKESDERVAKNARNISKTLKGHQLSQETREKIGKSNSIALKGNIPWNKGKDLPPLSKKHKQNISDGLKNCERLIGRPPVTARAILKQKGVDIEGKIVHHKNRNPKDNQSKNLEVMTRSEHSSLHAKSGETGWKYLLANGWSRW